MSCVGSFDAVAQEYLGSPALDGEFERSVVRQLRVCAGKRLEPWSG
jgi:hypothetical protein